MPEFILDHGTPSAARHFNDLDAFTQGYIEAMFFTDASDPDDGDLAHATFADLSAEALEQIKSDCTRFNLQADAWLHKAYLRGDGSYDMGRAGRDFWFTRNHHGVGFWDRGLGDVGDKLTEIAHGWRSTDLYRGDDERIYLA